MQAVESTADQAMPWPRIVGQAVHELRSPLSSMRVTLEILRLSPPDPEKQAMLLRMLDQQTDELAALLERLAEHPGTFVK